MQWKVIDSGISTAEENMGLDHKLLENLDTTSQPILHLYDWQKPSATYGLLTDPKNFLSLEALEEAGIELAARPTGGGIIFHTWDFAFSVLIPAKCSLFSSNTLENYALINRAVLQAIEHFLGENSALELISQDVEPKDLYCERFCMAKATKYDVVYRGKKIAGAAQRKTKKGFLHQGSISLSLPDEELLKKVLLPGSAVLEAMLHYTYPLLKSSAELKEAREWFKKNLVHFLPKVSE